MSNRVWVVVLALIAGCGNDASVNGANTAQSDGAGGNAVGGPAAGAVATGAAGTVAAAGTSASAGSGGMPAAAAANGGGPASGSGGAAGASPAANGGSSGGVAGTGTTAGMTASAGSNGGASEPIAGTGGTANPPALTDDDTLVPHPSWDCGMPEGIPPLASAELAFEATLQLGEVYDIGNTQLGKRTLIEIKGGTLKGPNIDATFLERGLDWQLTLPNGAVEVEQVNILQTSDGTNIYFRNCGTAAGPGDVRIVPDIEAPSGGRYDWLNTTKLAGTREFDPAAKTLSMKVYKLPATAAAGGGMVKVEEPAGLPDQTWECKKAMGRQGSVVYTESVGIGGGSVAVGDSKRGTRNIIPITGGTTTGRIEGGVLSGGADFQLSAGGEFILDARYTLKTKDNELIIVRNCGPIGALVPVFETRVDGPYAWVNANTWLSSDPSIGPGVVNLTIYETN